MPRVRFIVIFLALLAALEFVLLIDVFDSYAVQPFTRQIANVAGLIIGAMEPGVRINGTIISSPCFAVDIKNGCNGLEATFFVLAAVIAFPAVWRDRIIGIIIGAVLIQFANMARVVTLFLIGCHRREWFETFHLAVWQTVIFALAVGFFIFWSRRSAPKKNAAPA